MTAAHDGNSWRFWVGLVLVFLFILAMGPVILYGVPILFAMMMEAPRPVSIGLLLLLGVAPAAYFFFGLWAGHKFNEDGADRGDAGGDFNG